MTVSLSDLRELLYKLAKKYVSDDEANYYANEITEAYVRKYPRSNVLKDEVLADTDRQIKYSGNEIKIVKELPGVIQLDGNHMPITFKIKWIQDIVIAKAEKNGIAILTINNCGGMHSLHTWAQGIAKRGYFVFGAFNGGPNAVVPINGTRGLMGTNPITYGFPINEGEVVIDMATSEIPFFEINRASKNNTQLKQNVAVDTTGEITTDPHVALYDDGNVANLLPMGGNYKGYVINYLIEIMTGSLIGALLSNQQNPSYVTDEHGGFLIVMDIDAFSSKQRFMDEVSELNKVIRSQKPKQGVEKVIVPGDNNLERWHEAKKKNEVEVDEEIYQKLKQYAS